MTRTRKWIAGTMLLLLGATSVAVAGEDMYEGFRIVNVVVNGKQVQAPVPAITYKTTTMIPLRAVTEALGAKVDWNNDTRTATVSIAAGSQDPAGELAGLRAQVGTLQTDLSTTRTELASTKQSLAEAEATVKQLTDRLTPPPPSEYGRSRTNPAPTGTTMTASLKVTGLTASGRFTVSEVLRGDAAWQKIYAANQFNDQPDAGYEYLLVKMRYELAYINDTSAAINFSKWWFTAVSASGRDYPFKSAVSPKPEFGTNLYQGASDEGWLVFQVAKDDAAPVLTLARDSSGRNGYWMEVKPTGATPPR